MMLTDNEKQILEKVKQGLQPPSKAEIDDVTARWLYGKNAEKMMKYAPWSFVLMKLMWKKGEEPWAN
jgi:hypothetical protein